ncbi:hypothetical protein [Burkholderia glumae]
MQTLTHVPLAALAASMSYDERVAYLKKISVADVRADVFVRSATALGFRVTWDHANGTPILAWLH